MDHIKSETTPIPSPRDNVAEYLFDMIAQLARLARESNEVEVAIHLEAIIAARRAAARDPLE